MRASAKELDGIHLNLIAGQVPAELQGHLFMVAPVGSVNSQGLPNPDDSHVWNGNGLIYRFDFKPGEPTRLTTRLARTPCYWADVATRRGTEQASLGFHDWGMARFSISLGMRNQLNTAFVPMRFASTESERLLITFDGGRPYEIDPVSLRVITPIGSNKEWQAGIPFPFPFPAVLSTAHPAFDPVTSTLYTVNYGRSTGNFLSTIPLIATLARASNALAKFLWPITLPLHLILRPIGRFFKPGAKPNDFVHLLAWDGYGSLQRWSLVDKNGKSIAIHQTMHQIGNSKDYLIMADTSLKFGLEQLLPGPLQLPRPLALLLRRLLTKPQRDCTNVYIVRKSDLSSDGKNIITKCVTLPYEIGHFLVDYENPSGKITLHTAHENATDVSEWVRAEDTSPFDQQPLDPELGGMIAVGAMDLGRLGRYVINADDGTLSEAKTTSHKAFSWGMGLYAVREHGSSKDKPLAAIKSVYWQSLGFWPELLSEFVFKLYQDYPSRLMPLAELLKSTQPGERPSTLFRVDTETMAIADAYPFPQHRLNDGSWQSWICNSPQFVPRPKTEPATEATADNETGETVGDPETDGWIICCAISEQSKELWIFDAANLASGPLCKLSHPDFDPGYTIHTAWLQEIEPRSATYCIDAKADYDPLIAQASQAVRKLFKQDIYPRLDVS
jgi:hypothetical protein